MNVQSVRNTLGAGVAAVLLSGSDESTDANPTADEGAPAVETSETRPVTISGDLLPPLPESGADFALGLTMPELSGQSFDGTPVEIKNDGRPKIIMFLTHW
jgi:hypothetical protein